MLRVNTKYFYIIFFLLHLHFPTHRLDAPGIQQGRGRRADPDGRHRDPGGVATEGALGPQLHHGGGQGISAARAEPGAVALPDVRAGDRLSAGRGGAADAGADRGRIPPLPVHP